MDGCTKGVSALKDTHGVYKPVRVRNSVHGRGALKSTNQQLSIFWALCSTRVHLQKPNSRDDRGGDREATGVQTHAPQATVQVMEGGKAVLRGGGQRAFDCQRSVCFLTTIDGTYAPILSSKVVQRQANPLHACHTLSTGCSCSARFRFRFTGSTQKSATSQNAWLPGLCRARGEFRGRRGSFGAQFIHTNTASALQVVMYDEPTAGLDPVASTVVEDLMRDLHNDSKQVPPARRKVNELGVLRIPVLHQLNHLISPGGLHS
eukprot:1157296-Pelagomonas_calceolata.AAC.4